MLLDYLFRCPPPCSIVIEVQRHGWVLPDDRQALPEKCDRVQDKTTGGLKAKLRLKHLERKEVETAFKDPQRLRFLLDECDPLRRIAQLDQGVPQLKAAFVILEPDGVKFFLPNR